jgi:hypothetical protein
LVKKITQIETFNSSCHTAKGRHPESLVQDVEKVPGKVKEIVKSEIESREYVALVHADEQPTAVIHFVVPRAEIGEVMGEFCAWIDADALIPQDCLWKHYLLYPKSSSDPEKWRTELNRPLAS